MLHEKSVSLGNEEDVKLIIEEVVGPSIFSILSHWNKECQELGGGVIVTMDQLKWFMTANASVTCSDFKKVKAIKKL